MENKDSTAHDVSSLKHSFHARKSAKTTPAGENHSVATHTPTQQVGASEKRERFDVLHIQYY